MKCGLLSTILIFHRSMFRYPPIHLTEAPEEIDDYSGKYEALFKMLLEKGADPSLLIGICEDDDTTIFSQAVGFQSAVGYDHSIID